MFKEVFQYGQLRLVKHEAQDYYELQVNLMGGLFPTWVPITNGGLDDGMSRIIKLLAEDAPNLLAEVQGMMNERKQQRESAAELDEIAQEADERIFRQRESYRVEVG